MVIPHLHFNGNCKEAISFYEKAFNLKADIIIFDGDYIPNERKNNNKIAHAVMHIHGQKVFLNDRFGKKDTSTDIAIHLIVTFNSKDDLLSCYDKMKEDSILSILWKLCRIVLLQFNLLINSVYNGGFMV